MNTHPKAAIDLDELQRLTYSAVFSDVCDALGYRDQSFGHQIHPATSTQTVMVGWARPVVSRPVSEIPADKYAAEIAFIDSLGPGDLVVASSPPDAAFWGELFSSAAAGHGARGAIVDGLIRDVTRIEAVGFPIHAGGTRPTDCLGRISVDEVDEVVIQGVTIHRGDLVIADADGAVAVPKLIAAEASQRALHKAQTETDALSMLAEGALLSDVWNRFHVL